MEELNAQLALLLGGAAASSAFFDSSSPSGASPSMDMDTLAFFQGSVSPEFTSSPFFETSPVVDSMTIPFASTLSTTDVDALFTPRLSSSTQSLAPSPDMPLGSTASSSMVDLFPSMLGAGANADALVAALTAQMLASVSTPLPPAPIATTPPPGADLEFAAMLLNMVREKKSLPEPLGAPTPSVALPPAPAAVEAPLPPPIDPITGLPMKVKKKVGRKKKIRPTDPEIIAAELARKRSKNTEAARRSRMKRMQKVDSLEERLKVLEEEREEFEKRIRELEEEKERLEKRVEELEEGLEEEEEEESK